MFAKFTLGFLLLSGLSLTASAQIISQTKRPEIIAPETGKVETLKPNTTIGRSGEFMKVPRTGALLFAGFDRNGDYKIDRAEVLAGIKSAFAYADMDKNGILSLVELERWRIDALGYENSTPTNFAFAPNFARTVSRETFSAVLSGVAESLDKDDQGELDGIIFMPDLLKNYATRRAQKRDDNCPRRIRQAQREAEQQCRNRQGY